MTERAVCNELAVPRSRFAGAGGGSPRLNGVLSFTHCIIVFDHGGGGFLMTSSCSLFGVGTHVVGPLQDFGVGLGETPVWLGNDIFRDTWHWDPRSGSVGLADTNKEF